MGHDIGFATGDPWRDALLVDLGVALGALLDDLTARQAEIAGLILVDGARQVGRGPRPLGVSRATVLRGGGARGGLRAIAGVRHAVEELLAGTTSSWIPAGSQPAPLHPARDDRRVDRRGSRQATASRSRSAPSPC
jgi:hypothetical protein